MWQHSWGFNQVKLLDTNIYDLCFLKSKGMINIKFKIVVKLKGVTESWHREGAYKDIGSILVLGW